MDKITLVCDPELEASYQADRNRWAHRLEVTLEDGRVLTRQVEYPYGDFNNPFTWAYEHEKFHTLPTGFWARTGLPRWLSGCRTWRSWMT